MSVKTTAFNKTIRLLCLAILPTLGAVGCASFQKSLATLGNHTTEPAYLSSGTLVISQQMPSRVASSRINHSAELTALNDHTHGGEKLAPLLGYFPPAVTYLPADNETWLQIRRTDQKITLFKGKEVVQEFVAEGPVTLAPGDYYLQHKQKEPTWYAPDQYFVNRQLVIPAESDRTRYRRGALGQFALFPTTTFPIHCSAIWSEEVGGLRLSTNDLSAIYYALPVGTPIVVQ